MSRIIIKYQSGGPIIVDSKLHPRYQSYRDSLDLHNNNLQGWRSLLLTKGVSALHLPDDWSAEEGEYDPYKVVKNTITGREASYGVNINNNRSSRDSRVIEGIEPVRRDTYDSYHKSHYIDVAGTEHHFTPPWSGDLVYRINAARYKKPVQEVMVRESTPMQLNRTITPIKPTPTRAERLEAYKKTQQYKDTVEKQNKLKESGLDVTIDGIWGPKSQAAWDKLQEPKVEPIKEEEREMPKKKASIKTHAKVRGFLRYTSPTDDRYGYINRGDKKGDVELTREQYEGMLGSFSNSGILIKY